MLLKLETDSTILIQGDQSIDLLPYVERVIHDLGYVQPRAASWIAANAALFAFGCPGRDIRERGTQLSYADRLGLGLPKYGYHLCREVWEILTPKGRTDPESSFDDTVMQALSAARNEMQRQRSLHARDILPWSVVSTNPSYPVCPEMKALEGRLLEAPPIIPLPTCHRRCYCSYCDVGRVEAKRLGFRTA